ncbi:MAG: ABC transporter permease [Acidobacteria bacterium]|nr:ABC transporter permease [Acidobacteriota bacterium]
MTRACGKVTEMEKLREKTKRTKEITNYPFVPYPRRRWRIALTSGLSIVIGCYLLALFADFLSPYDHRKQSRLEPSAPPSTLHFRDKQGQWSVRPFIHRRQLANSLDRHYKEDRDDAYGLEFFTHGYQYKLFCLFTTDRHLFGVRGAERDETPRFYLLGTDGLGRDRLSRLLVAARFSLLVGPLGTLLASLLGILIGCIAGYAGRWIDAVLMRAADVTMALPTLVLVLAARAAYPLELPKESAATLLITIFLILGWAEMARLTRGLVMELQEREFVLAARSIGLSPAQVLWRHILANAKGPLAVQALLMLPAFLLAETALSFLGVGLQEPDASWGNMLTEASELTLLERGDALLVLSPAIAIVLFVLGVRLLSDGLEAKEEGER